MKLEEFKEKLAKASDQKVLKIASRNREEIPAVAWQLIEKELENRGLDFPEKPATKTSFHPVLPMQDQPLSEPEESQEKSEAIAKPDESSKSSEPETRAMEALPKEHSELKESNLEKKTFHPPAKTYTKTSLDWDELVGSKVTMAVLLVAFSGLFASLMRSIFLDEN